MTVSYKVAIQYDNECGVIEYDADEKNINVILPNEDKKNEVISFLQRTHLIKVAGLSTIDFHETVIDPLEDVEQLKTALTRLWQKTKVAVDWSRPV
ncbi:hypothetical protein LJC10_05875 [Selenomonadales bacterium OttesenSCG-928-I06]|nr:hypothetical protein [Selenomonadales bacterium OttesenSCG-928-I06]